MKKYDAIIVGAGITGLASAYYIKKMNQSARIAVVDKNGSFCQGNTAKSAAAFRDLFSSEVNRKITKSSIGFYKHVQDDMGVDLGLAFNGYLFLGDKVSLDNSVFKSFIDSGMARYLDEEEVIAMGYRTKPSVEERMAMNIPEIDGGLLGYDCGIMDPEKICRYYGNELVKMGVDVFFNTEVFPPRFQPKNPLNYPGEPFIWQEYELKSIETSKGEFFASEFVFCTDVWTTKILNSMGIDSHTRGKKRQVFQISGPEVEVLLRKNVIKGRSAMPLTILPPCEIVMRPDPASHSIWVTIADDLNRDFSISEDPQPEPEFYEKNLFPILSAYLPQLRNSKISSSWAGHYAYNTIDKTHYVFREKNVIVATGSSGSGIMKADAVGRVVASMFAGSDKTVLFDNSVIGTTDLSIHQRKVEEEKIVI